MPSGACALSSDCSDTLPLCTGNVCSSCTLNSQCAFYTNKPYCHKVSGICTSDSKTCALSSDCSATLPLCTGNECSKCTLDSHCSSYTDTPHCNTVSGSCTSTSTSGSCVTASDCSDTLPRCKSNVCSKCTKDSHCSLYSSKPICNTEYGVCTESSWFCVSLDSQVLIT